LLDRLCSGLPDVLTADGCALIVHSEVCGEQATVAAMAAIGLDARVVARATLPFGPVMRARAALLRLRAGKAAGMTIPDASDPELETDKQPVPGRPVPVRWVPVRWVPVRCGRWSRLRWGRQGPPARRSTHRRDHGTA
jgi:hypothetical protein